MKMNENFDISGFKKKEFAIFCGAGISKSSGLPLANELKQCILEKLPIDKKDMDEIMNSILPFEAFIETLSENTDISRILDIFEDGMPNTNHIVIARLAKNGHLKLIFTTNFDLLIEKALEEEGLKRDKDFEVYYDEEQFLKIDFGNMDDGVIRIFKIHGSVDDRESIRTTMKTIASKTLSYKRMDIMRYLFSTGRHKKVIILGYSCSDEFDITPQIRSIHEKQKQIIFVEHSKEGREIEDVRVKEQKNPFKTFPGKRIKCNTDDFIRELWDSHSKTIGGYEPAESKVDWGTYVNDWAETLKENNSYLKYLIASLILYFISKFNRAIVYSNKSLEIANEVRDKKKESECYRILGNCYGHLGDNKKALEFYNRSLEISADSAQVSRCYSRVSSVYHKMRNFESAIKFQEKALEISKQNRDKEGEAKSYVGLGKVYIDLRELRRAHELIEKALEMAKEIGNKNLEAGCYVEMGIISFRVGSLETLSETEKALEIYKALGYKPGIAICYENLRRILWSLEGDFDLDIEYRARMSEVLEEMGNDGKSLKKKLSRE